MSMECKCHCHHSELMSSLNHPKWCMDNGICEHCIPQADIKTRSCNYVESKPETKCRHWRPDNHKPQGDCIHCKKPEEDKVKNWEIEFDEEFLSGKLETKEFEDIAHKVTTKYAGALKTLSGKPETNGSEESWNNEFISKVVLNSDLEDVSDKSIDKVKSFITELLARKERDVLGAFRKRLSSKYPAFAQIDAAAGEVLNEVLSILDDLEAEKKV
jgi:hypothetical protein